MNFQSEIDDFNNEISEKRRIILKNICSFLYKNNLDIVVRSSTSSNDEGGSDEYNEYYLVDKSVIDILEDPKFEELSDDELASEESETNCDNFGVRLSSLHDKVKSLDFGISEYFLEESISIQSDWDSYYVNYLVTNEDGTHFVNSSFNTQLFNNAFEY